MAELNLVEDSEVVVSSSKNETVIKINVGLHPKDIEKVQDMVIEFLRNDAVVTKEFITEINKIFDSKYYDKNLNSH